MGGGTEEEERNRILAPFFFTPADSRLSRLRCRDEARWLEFGMRRKRRRRRRRRKRKRRRWKRRRRRRRRKRRGRRRRRTCLQPLFR